MYWRGGKLQSIGEVDILEKQMQKYPEGPDELESSSCAVGATIIYRS